MDESTGAMLDERTDFTNVEARSIEDVFHANVRTSEPPSWHANNVKEQAGEAATEEAATEEAATEEAATEEAATEEAATEEAATEEAATEEAATEEAATFESMPDVLLQEVGTHCAPASFRALVTTCKSLRNALALTAPGLKSGRADGVCSLYKWQAFNVHFLVGFLRQRFHQRIAGKSLPTTEGFVLCDAPGGGKTVSVLATIARTIPARSGPWVPRESTCIVFAPKVIVPQWADQIARHFRADVSGLRLYCAASELHLYDADAVSPLLLARTVGGGLARDDKVAAHRRGGVYIEQRPTAELPPTDVLASFDIVVLPKEMLSMRTDLSGASQKEKNDAAVRRLRPHTRLVIIDESHNLSAAGVISNQLLNVEAFAGVPKLLMSGTPGTAPRRLYDMLALIRHESWRSGGGYKQWLKQRFVPSSHLVRPDKEAGVVRELNSCFLHTPPEEIFAQRAPHRTTRTVVPSETEAMSYNFVLSLHQRDVLRAGPGKAKPAEWARKQGKGQLDWQQRGGSERSGPQSALKEASAEKTMVELMCATNGGELWVVNTKRKGAAHKLEPTALPRDHPAYLDRLVTAEGKPKPDQELPECSTCHVCVPGVLSLPCRCDTDLALCVECFRDEVADFKGRCEHCDAPRMPFKAWAKTQPWLEVQSAAEVDYDAAQIQSWTAQQGMHLQRVHNILLRQPEPRPFAPATVARTESLAAVDDETIRQMASPYAKVGELALLLKKLKYPLGLAGGRTDAKVLIVPPAHKDVRDTFTAGLREALGRDAVSDLNDCGGRSGGKKDVKLETAVALNKFRKGCGRYWQCSCCGELYEEATKACSTTTFRVVLEPPEQDPEQEALRFIKDVVKVDGSGATDANQTIFIDNRVAVCTPSQPRRMNDPLGKVVAKGSCHGKRPTARDAFIPAPEGSCFVLILNASGIEGLDLGEATVRMRGADSSSRPTHVPKVQMSFARAPMRPRVAPSSPVVPSPTPVSCPLALRLFLPSSAPGQDRAHPARRQGAAGGGTRAPPGRVRPAPDHPDADAIHHRGGDDGDDHTGAPAAAHVGGRYRRRRRRRGQLEPGG